MSFVSGQSPVQDKPLSLYDRLTIIQELIQELGPQSTLKVVVNDDPMSSVQTLSQQGNTVYMYELIGSKSLRKTQNNNLLQKLDVFEKKQLQNKNKPPKSIQPTVYEDQNKFTSPKETPHKPLQDAPQKSMYRYFNENVKCFRCKRLGHYDYSCPDEFNCTYCLSPAHHPQRCPQKIVCFRCYNFGHIVNDCPLKQDGPYCQNCKRKHNQKCAFLMKGMQQVKQLFVMDSLYQHEDIRCLKCLKYGHFNCEATQGERDYRDRDRDRDRDNNRNQQQGYYKRSYRPEGDSRERKQSRDRFNNPNNKRHKY